MLSGSQLVSLCCCWGCLRSLVYLMANPDELEIAAAKIEKRLGEPGAFRMDDEPALRLILSANREMRERVEAAKDEAAERDAFEEWYAADMVAFGFTRTTPADVKALRDGPDYGDRLALNSKWEGWFARSALTTQRGE